MKKMLILLILSVIAVSFTHYGRQADKVMQESEEPRLFFVDRRLHRLISLEAKAAANTQKTARKIVNELVVGRDENVEILRIIPNDADLVQVSVKNNSACVNFSSDIIPKLSKNPETERLFVYQFVNSLTSVDGIDSVTFTIDGKIQKKFLGFLDMREIFTSNYDI